MRQKRNPKGLEKANKRLAGLKSIQKPLDFGSDLTISRYEGDIVALQTKVTNYNTMLSTLDEQLSLIKKMEDELSDVSERMLMGVATQFGKNSEEYLMAGGTKKSERKPRKKKPSLPKI